MSLYRSSSISFSLGLRRSSVVRRGGLGLPFGGYGLPCRLKRRSFMSFYLAFLVVFCCFGALTTVTSLLTLKKTCLFSCHMSSKTHQGSPKNHS